MNATMTTAYLGRCKTKGCKTALRADGLEYVSDGPTASEPGVAYCVGNYGGYARCAVHGLYQLRTLKGRTVEGKKCDGRCRSATGPNCDCSCGGANHGANHG